MLPHPFESRVIDLAMRDVQREAIYQAHLRLASSGRPGLVAQASAALRHALGTVLITAGDRLGGRRLLAPDALSQSPRPQ